MGPFFMSVSTLEPVSGQVGLCFPGKVILGGRGRTVMTSVEAQCEKSRDQVDPAERRQYVGIWRRPPEISGVRRLIGGPGRSPTLGRINGLQKVRVEIAPLNAKEDFAATRTPSPAECSAFVTDAIAVCTALTLAREIPPS